MEQPPIPFVFFGTPQFAVGVLGELEKAGLLPSLVVTSPDKPRGRKLLIAQTEVKVWAQKRNIPVLQPEKLDSAFGGNLSAFDLFVVVAYGKIIPKHILDLPKFGTLNVHPSLLPRLRGASPIQSAILAEEKTGVSIMLLDEETDHGPILVQKEYVYPKEFACPPKASELEVALARLGGKMLAEIIPKYVTGEITPVPQDHSRATYCKKIKKEDGLLDLDGDDFENFKKIQAFNVWPRAYFFRDIDGKKTRIIVTEAEFRDGKLLIQKILPEGGREMPYSAFERKFEK